MTQRTMCKHGIYMDHCRTCNPIDLEIARCCLIDRLLSDGCTLAEANELADEYAAETDSVS